MIGQTVHAPASKKPLKVAFVHYWMINFRGGEKVIEALCELFPQADIFTHVYNPDKMSDTIRKHKVETTFISKLPGAQKHYQKYLPLMPTALEQLDLTDYDLVISSESGPAKGVIVRPDAVHICYTHSPMRYLWDQYHTYRNNTGWLKRMVMFWTFGALRQWDVTSAARVDKFVANSRTVANRINKYWRRDAQVIAPPVEANRFEHTKPREEFYLYVGEFVHYKRADLAVKACTTLDRPLVIVGGGEEEKAMRKIAGKNVKFAGKVSDEELTRLYETCKAFIFPAEEDFGIVPVEAMAAGAPVIAYGRGGASETVLNGKTGLFFYEQTEEALIDAIKHFEKDCSFNPDDCAARAEEFSKDVFKNNMRDCINKALDGKFDSSL